MAQWLRLLSTPLDLYRLHIAFFVLEGMLVKRTFFHPARLHQKIEVFRADVCTLAIVLMISSASVELIHSSLAWLRGMASSPFLPSVVW